MEIKLGVSASSSFLQREGGRRDVEEKRWVAVVGEERRRKFILFIDDGLLIAYFAMLCSIGPAGLAAVDMNAAAALKAVRRKTGSIQKCVKCDLKQGVDHVMLCLLSGSQWLDILSLVFRAINLKLHNLTTWVCSRRTH